ncbi:hypothetical protein SAMN05444396_11168 [Flavobacterium segetis]|uniref:Uncharacterized protein n=1 Tax=Flavobacterium segetis TaxID=271157 RepID=A0A1M5JKL3_9FLAO|nr:hypothetical protein [Flavobacterium segetis]SHG41102.1 hypothetical protein SAMN05444396_11168 [Flavobacterium segetis]
MTVHEIIGNYSISGSNQQQGNDFTYSGILKLSLDKNHRIIAHWFINNEQVQSGAGFFKDNILVINFQYQGELNTVFKGVAVYRCLNKNVLDGFWSEKHGNPLYLGTERALRIISKDLLN